MRNAHSCKPFVEHVPTALFVRGLVCSVCDGKFVNTFLLSFTFQITRSFIQVRDLQFSVETMKELAYNLWPVVCKAFCKNSDGCLQLALKYVRHM